MFFVEANPAQRAVVRFAGSRPGSWFFARALHHLDAPVLRRTGGGRSVTSALSGLPVIQITTTGARTGQPRTLPLIAVPDGDRLVLVASNYGQERHPAWYHNLKAHPRCDVLVGGRQVEMTAYEAEGDERERLWALDNAVYPPRTNYAQRAAHRRIPVMVLEPVPSPA